MLHFNNSLCVYIRFEIFILVYDPEISPSASLSHCAEAKQWNSFF